MLYWLHCSSIGISGIGNAMSLKIGYYAGQSWNRFASRVKQYDNQWSKPAFPSMAEESHSDLRRSLKDLSIENAILRQQLIVLNRQVKRPQLTQGDRVIGE